MFTTSRTQRPDAPRETLPQIAMRIADAVENGRLYPGSRWRHNVSRDLYSLHRVTVNESDMRLMVSYVPITEIYARHPVTFNRPVSEFVERFTMVSV